jgi:hypothetical protein
MEVTSKNGSKKAPKRGPGKQMTDCDFADNAVDSFFAKLAHTIDERFEICELLNSDQHKKCTTALHNFHDVWIEAKTS